MSALNASDAKREFGDVLLKAQKAPVKINKTVSLLLLLFLLLNMNS